MAPGFRTWIRPGVKTLSQVLQPAGFTPARRNG